MTEKDDSQHIILTSFEDEYEETHDPIWVWHAIDFCSNWQRKTGDPLPYPQWVTDHLSLVADSILKLDDRTSDVSQQVSDILGIKERAISSSIQTIRNKLIYFEIQSQINQGNESAQAVETVAQTFSLNIEVVENIYRKFTQHGRSN